MNQKMRTYQVDKKGYYDEFGGAYVPEILHQRVEDLQNTYLQILENDSFKEEFDQLLCDYIDRPSPLYLTRRLSEKYGYKIYLKRGDLNRTGAYKVNSTISQILLTRRMGETHTIAETDAGQHGMATATVCILMNVECVVYIRKADVERQHANVQKMEVLGTTIMPMTPGNIALKDTTSEAIRDWYCHSSDTYYIIGSTVGPHPYPSMVTRLQPVISEEIKRQLLEKEGGDHPDYLITCVGGGSNAVGTIYHFVDGKWVKIVLAEAGDKGIHSGMNAATIQLGEESTIHGARTLIIQNEGGQIEEPYSVSASLDYPGIGPIHTNLSVEHRAQVLTVDDDEALDAAFELTRLEGVIPALESVHASGALAKVNFKPEEVMVLTISDRGNKDMDTYINCRLKIEN